MELINKTAIICGSTDGIGLSIAELFALKGCNIILFARNENKLKIIAKELNSGYNIDCKYLVADFTDALEVKKVIEQFYTINNIKIDILLNNVGGVNPELLSQSSPESIRLVFEKHIVSSNLITMNTVNNMRQHKTPGKIINICANTSISPYYGLGLSAIRAVEIYASKTLALELAKYNIMVNNILPGATNTRELEKIIRTLAENEGLSFEEKREQVLNSLPLKRFAEPEEIAQVALFLASDKATYITGADFKIDGGFNVSL